MSGPPPYGGGPPRNPDARPLPQGWITEFDPNYNAWFYVNTLTQPPVTTWTHPLGAPPSPGPPQGGYAPPPGGPENRGPGGYYPQQQGYPGQYGGGSPYPPQGGYGGPGYQQSPPPGQYAPYNQGYQGAPPQEGRGLFGGMFGGGRPQQPIMASPPPQTVYVEEQPKKSGIGMGGALALGAGGLLGGALLADAFDGHDGGDDGGDDGGRWGGDDGGGDDGGGDDGGGDW
ncbi:WW domain-containing protein [Mycena chlorophos]|uniref:WW domain-containing protein n=1 Tax=Mycena chlorophos TaxID=658473 RepID=A0A8H6TAV7_MYCCL|nr:WW domain-containing protein [Mycena chlorophos]